MYLRAIRAPRHFSFNVLWSSTGCAMAAAAAVSACSGDPSASESTELDEAAVGTQGGPLQLPVQPREWWWVLQGNNNTTGTHNGQNKYAFDFARVSGSS